MSPHDISKDNEDKFFPDGCILYKEQYQFICKTSFLCIISGIYALHRGYYGMALGPTVVFLTSINYWRKPDFSWRRYVDMAVVKISLLCHFITSIRSNRFWSYNLTIVTSVLFYLLGIEYYKRKMYWHSTYSHSMLHLIANVANIILYSGEIEPFYSIISEDCLDHPAIL